MRPVDLTKGFARVDKQYPGQALASALAPVQEHSVTV